MAFPSPIPPLHWDISKHSSSSNECLCACSENYLRCFHLLFQGLPSDAHLIRSLSPLGEGAQLITRGKVPFENTSEQTEQIPCLAAAALSLAAAPSF